MQQSLMRNRSIVLLGVDMVLYGRWVALIQARVLYLHTLFSRLSPKPTGQGLDPNSKHFSCFLAARGLIVAQQTDHSERVSQSLLIVGTRILSRRLEIGLSSHP